jgi:hypothetical protein
VQIKKNGEKIMSFLKLERKKIEKTQIIKFLKKVWGKILIVNFLRIRAKME